LHTIGLSVKSQTFSYPFEGRKVENLPLSRQLSTLERLQTSPKSALSRKVLVLAQRKKHRNTCQKMVHTQSAVAIDKMLTQVGQKREKPPKITPDFFFPFFSKTITNKSLKKLL
jgi:hypothetical protein